MSFFSKQIYLRLAKFIEGSKEVIHSYQCHLQKKYMRPWSSAVHGVAVGQNSAMLLETFSVWCPYRGKETHVFVQQPFYVP